MTAPLDVDSASMQAGPEEVLEGIGGKKIQGRSLSQIAWMRLKRDRVAIASGIVIVIILLLAIFGKYVAQLEGKGWTYKEADSGSLNPNNFYFPKGALGGVSSQHWFGVEPQQGRDMFARVMYGLRISMIVSLSSTFLTTLIGVVMGVVAGYFGRTVDNLISRFMDLLLAFPQLLFLMALTPVVYDRLTHAGLPASNTTRITMLIIIISFFGWPYIGRIVRGQTLSLREREFVDAARALGAKPSHILFRQILPNLWAPILVYATLIIPTYIALEAALSFLGVGILPPTPSMGNILSGAATFFATDPAYLFIPGCFLIIVVLVFNLFGDGLRDALDPRSNR